VADLTLENTIRHGGNEGKVNEAEEGESSDCGRRGVWQAPHHNGLDVAKETLELGWEVGHGAGDLKEEPLTHQL